MAKRKVKSERSEASAKALKWSSLPNAAKKTVSSFERATKSDIPCVLVEPTKNRRAPVEYAPDIIEEIAARISRGESLARVCLDPNMPTLRSVLVWQNAREDVRESLSRARAVAMERMADEIRDISDNFAVPVDRARVMVQSRQWILEKMQPDRFGNHRKVTMDQGSTPLVVEHRHSLDLSRLSPQSRAVIEAELQRALLAQSGGADDNPVDLNPDEYSEG